jgi:hypothetical protein
LRFSRQIGDLLARVALPNADGWHASVVRGREIVFVESADVEVSGFPLQAFDLETGNVRSLGRFVRDKKRFPFGDPDWKGWFALGSLGDEATITLWPGKGMVVAQTHVFDLETLAVGQRLPWDSHETHGRLLVTETEETDGVRVRDLVAGTEVCRVAFDPGERRRSRGRYDVASGTLASTVSGSRIGVWGKDGRRLFSLPGHDLPLVAGCAAWLACRLIPEPHNQTAYDLFIGEVVGAWADARAFADGRWRLESADPAWRSLHHVAGGHFYATGEALSAVDAGP